MTALLDHLWQSTAFVALAWLVARRLRANGAHVRYAVWLAASIKFLVPFAVLAAFAQQLGVDAAPAITSSAAYKAAHLATYPATAASPGGQASISWLVLIAIVWAAGCAALLARWFVGWLGIVNVVRSSRPANIAAPIPVHVSPLMSEPGVVGIFRPVLVLPAGISSRLSAAQLEAIVDHELCHVRRRDNLTAALHMLVEALFWFHPLVWWIGARLVEERERACDESVVRAGSDPLVYAEGILAVCRSRVAPMLPCVSGVSGADLKLRLEAIMQRQGFTKLNGFRKASLAVLAMAVFAVPVLVGLTVTNDAHAAGNAASPAVGKIELLAGRKVKLDYRNVEVRELLQALAAAAKVNMLVSDKVAGTVTVRLEEMPWEQALDVVLHSQGLRKREQDGILFIETASGA